MSQYSKIPVNAKGIIAGASSDAAIQPAANSSFRCTDLFVYSYGWWNTAGNATSDCNRFSICFMHHLQQLMESAPAAFPRFASGVSSLAVDLHWPSLLSENQSAARTFLDTGSFFSMQHRADDVGAHAGYSLLRAIIGECQRQPSLRVHLIGHSFGCRVLCSALQRLTSDSAAINTLSRLETRLSLVLLQAAADADSLAPGRVYGAILEAVPNLRVLVSKSDHDRVLGKWYPTAQRLAHLLVDPQRALGSVGPMGIARTSFAFLPGTSPVALLKKNFVVADLTTLHRVRVAMGAPDDSFSGQHTDINVPEVYELVARFL